VSVSCDVEACPDRWWLISRTSEMNLAYVPERNAVRWEKPSEYGYERILQHAGQGGGRLGPFFQKSKTSHFSGTRPQGLSPDTFSAISRIKAAQLAEKRGVGVQSCCGPMEQTVGILVITAVRETFFCEIRFIHM
jgi:hypothetical protein